MQPSMPSGAERQNTGGQTYNSQQQLNPYQAHNYQQENPANIPQQQYYAGQGSVQPQPPYQGNPPMTHYQSNVNAYPGQLSQNNYSQPPLSSQSIQSPSSGTYAPYPGQTQFQQATNIYSQPSAQRPSIPPPGAPYPGSANYPTSSVQNSGIPSIHQDPVRSNSQNRINPNMIPSPVTVNETDQAKFNETSFITSTLGSQSPPLPSTMARYVDDGNSSPRFMRLTSYMIPCSEDVLHASRLPLALIMQPFAQRPSYEVVFVPV